MQALACRCGMWSNQWVFFTVWQREMEMLWDTDKTKLFYSFVLRHWIFWLWLVDDCGWKHASLHVPNVSLAGRRAAKLSWSGLCWWLNHAGFWIALIAFQRYQRVHICIYHTPVSWERLVLFHACSCSTKHDLWWFVRHLPAFPDWIFRALSHLTPTLSSGLRPLCLGLSAYHSSKLDFKTHSPR